MTSEFVLRYFYDLKREKAAGSKDKLVSFTKFLARERSLDPLKAEKLGGCLLDRYSSPVDLINGRAEWQNLCHLK